MERRRGSEMVRFKCSMDLRLEIIDFYRSILLNREWEDKFLKPIFDLEDEDAFVAILFALQDIFLLCRDNIIEAIRLEKDITAPITMEDVYSEIRDDEFKGRCTRILEKMMEAFVWEDEVNIADTIYFLDLIPLETFFLIIKFFQCCLSVGLKSPRKAKEYYSGIVLLSEKLEF